MLPDLFQHSIPILPHDRQIEKDEMTFGKGHKRPISEWARSFAERRYPIATGSSMQIYGWLFIAVGVFFGILALGALRSAV